MHLTATVVTRQMYFLSQPLNYHPYCRLLIVLLISSFQPLFCSYQNFNAYPQVVEVHLDSIRLPLSSSISLTSCCLNGTWIPPTGCSSKCKLRLQICISPAISFPLNAPNKQISEVITAKRFTVPTRREFGCGKFSLGIVNTGIVYENNNLFNSSLDFRILMKRPNKNNKPLMLEVDIYHDSIQTEILLCRMNPIEFKTFSKKHWTTSHIIGLPHTLMQAETQSQLSDIELFKLTLSYRSQCKANYYGLNCDRFCQSRNSALGHYRCDLEDGRVICLPGWTGTLCTTAVCEKQCIHGICSAPDVCTCHNGWEGKRCGQCQTFPGCEHGVCFFNWSSGHLEPFTCACNDGWSGMFCSIDQHFCSNHPKMCENDGICINTPSEDGLSTDYSCSCNLGTEGFHCELTNRDCNIHSCSGKGICQRETGECVCDDGYYGANCEQNATDCSQNPCQGKMSVCVEQSDRKNVINANFTGKPKMPSFRCECEAGRTGVTCESNIRQCDKRPCLNGGKCINLANGYACVCPFKYSGRHCEIAHSACEHLPCANGGECVDRANRVECLCPNGWTGLTCRDNVNECMNKNICKNGGSCRDLPGSYECRCIEDWSGSECDILKSNFTEVCPSCTPSVGYSSHSDWRSFYLPRALAITSIIVLLLLLIACLVIVIRNRNHSKLHSTTIKEHTPIVRQSLDVASCSTRIDCEDQFEQLNAYPIKRDFQLEQGLYNSKFKTAESLELLNLDYSSSTPMFHQFAPTMITPSDQHVQLFYRCNLPPPPAYSELLKPCRVPKNKV